MCWLKLMFVECNLDKNVKMLEINICMHEQQKNHHDNLDDDVKNNGSLL